MATGVGQTGLMKTSSPSTLGALDRALQEVGDRWSLMVVAALSDGPSRFNELQAAINGIAPNILSRRLRDLEAAGLIVASPYQDRPVRMEYRLTAAGSELAGVLVQLAAWGDQRPAADAAIPAASGGSASAHELRHATCGTRLESRWWCRSCERTVEPDEEPGLHDL